MPFYVHSGTGEVRFADTGLRRQSEFVVDSEIAQAVDLRHGEILSPEQRNALRQGRIGLYKELARTGASPTRPASTPTSQPAAPPMARPVTTSTPRPVSSAPCSFNCGHFAMKQLGKARFDGRSKIRVVLPRKLLPGNRKAKISISEVSSVAFVPLDTYIGGATGTWAVYLQATKSGKTATWRFPFFQTLTKSGVAARHQMAITFVHSVGRAAGLTPTENGRAVVYARGAALRDLRQFTVAIDAAADIETADPVFFDDDSSDFDA